MTANSKVNDYITRQLDSQGISYEFLTDEELDDVAKNWTDKFIAKRTAPDLEKYRWHIFSFHSDNRLEGDAAKQAYKKQYSTEILIFNGRLQFGLRCNKSNKLPDISMENFHDDIYICHHSMKWTFVTTHESLDFGPYFSS